MMYILYQWCRTKLDDFYHHMISPYCTSYSSPLPLLSAFNFHSRTNLVSVYFSSSSLTPTRPGILNLDSIDIWSQNYLHNLQGSVQNEKRGIHCSKWRNNVTWKIKCLYFKYKTFSFCCLSLFFSWWQFSS